MTNVMSTQVGAAYTLLLKRIISYDLMPGTVISDYSLAKELTMSRAPIREAILYLTMDGLIQTAGNGKTIIAPIGLEDIIEMLRIRNVLETEAVSIIADNGWLSKSQCQALETYHQQLLDADKDLATQHELDDLFHTTLVSYCNSPRIIQILGQMRLQMQRARWIFAADPMRLTNTSKEHQAILQALCEKDLDACVAAIQVHCINSRLGFEKILNGTQLRQIMNCIGKPHQIQK